MTTVVWFRRDLRIHDNPALAAAVMRGAVLPVYILDDVTPAPHWRMGAASRWWLHHSLSALAKDLGHLALLRGDPRLILPNIIQAAGASAVHWNRCYEPFAIARDKSLKTQLQGEGIEVNTFNASLLHEPWEVATSNGGPFRVFTPFWRASQSKPVPEPHMASHRGPQAIAPVEIKSDGLADWRLLPVNPDWASKWYDWWRPGEAGALERFDDFVATGLIDYAHRRDRPDLKATSLLSPHLHFGELSPRHIWARLALEDRESQKSKGIRKFLDELGWREFAHHLLYHFPTLPDQNWRASFDAYPWLNRPTDLHAWQQGRTGYPSVDAAMRELWQTGWMHP
jgi:deoxyribodipyrimidine photo-lyase